MLHSVSEYWYITKASPLEEKMWLCNKVKDAKNHHVTTFNTILSQHLIQSCQNIKYHPVTTYNTILSQHLIPSCHTI